MSEPANPYGTSPQWSWLMALPLIAFLALAAIFWFRLGSGDPSNIPSALIGRPAPQTVLPPLQGLVNDGEHSKIGFQYYARARLSGTSCA